MKNSQNFKQDAIEFLNGFKTMANDLRTKGRRAKQIPNLLSLSRLGCAFVIPPLAISGNLIAAAIVTVLALLTDAVDGKIARKLDAVSEFGKNLDPICDKVLAGSLLLPLIGKVSPLLSVGLCANLGLELGIAGVNLKSKAKGNIPRTTLLGKFKTVALSLLIAAIYISISYQSIASIIPIIYAIATATQAVTLIDYQKIDKMKDKLKKKEKKIIEIKPVENPNKSDFSKAMNKGSVEHFISKVHEQKQCELLETVATTQSQQQITYSSDDFKNLKKEIIRTITIPNKHVQEEIKDSFQKTK